MANKHKTWNDKKQNHILATDLTPMQSC